jgi:hypothetical protein
MSLHPQLDREASEIPPANPLLMSQQEGSNDPATAEVGSGIEGQSESELMTSPPCEDPTAIQEVRLIEFLKNLTLPSHMAAFTPPGW